MSFKKVFSCSFVLFALFGVGVTSAATSLTPVRKASANVSRLSSFENETHIGDDLSVSILAASTTDYSTAFDVKFSTGGNAFVDNGNMVNVLGNDDSLMAFYEEFNKLSTEEKAQWRQDVKKGIKTTEFFEGYIHSFKMDHEKVYAPRTLSRGVYGVDAVFTVTLDTIASNAFTSNARVKELYIPKEIQNIPADAFSNVSAGLTKIYLEHASAPAGFESGWNQSAEVEYNVDIYADAPTREHVTSIATNEVGDPSINYILGYYPEDDEQFPLAVTYEIEKEDHSTETRELIVDNYSKLYPYNGVGKGIAAYSTALTFNIEHQKNEKVNPDSLVVHNIFAAIGEMIDEKQTWSPDKTKRYFSTAHKAFEVERNLSDFLKVSFNSISTFGGYTAVNARVDVVNKGLVYKTLKPRFYDTYKKQIDNGSAKIRFRFTSLINAKYHVTYGNEDKVIKVETPIPQFILSKYENNNFTLVVKNSAIGNNFNPDALKTFSINNISVTVDIVLNGVILTKTASATSFGSIYLLRNNDLKKFDVDLFFILFAIIYLVAAAGISAGLFFYFKNKFKNDEFRRLKPKQFIKKAVIYALTSLAVALAICFVVIRLTAFANAVVAVNPLDPFIVIFGIATIIIIGYYVKNLVAFVKANNQRKRSIKLGLINEQADDGTK